MPRIMKSRCEKPQPQRNLVKGGSPRVKWRETRSSTVVLRETRSAYFLNITIHGLKRLDAELKMDNTRGLVMNAHKYVRDIGMVGCRYRLVEQAFGSSTRRSRRPFRIPEDVNVDAITPCFRRGSLHIVMPKLRQGDAVKELPDQNIEGQSVLPRQHAEKDDMRMIITVEENIPTPKAQAKDEIETVLACQGGGSTASRLKRGRDGH